MNKVLENYYKTRIEHDKALDDLNKEALRIVNVIKSVFKLNNRDTWWSYQYYDGEYAELPLPEKIEDNTFPIHISKVADSGSWYYHEGFPVIFFDMNDEEIADYLKKEIAENKEKEAQEKAIQAAKKEMKKIKEQELKKSAAEKLTQEEKKALGLK